MRFNWILNDTADDKLHKLCVDIEYKLRPKIVKFLILNFDFIDCCTDFSCFHFNVDLCTNTVTVDEQTPSFYREAITLRFEQEIKIHLP